MIKLTIKALLIVSAGLFSAYATAATVLTGGGVTIEETTVTLQVDLNTFTTYGTYNVNNGSAVDLYAIAISNNSTTSTTANGSTASDGAYIFWDANMVNGSTWDTYQIYDSVDGWVTLGSFGAFTDFFAAGDSVNLYWAAESELLNAGALVADAFLFEPAILESSGVVFGTGSTAIAVSAVPVPAAVWLFGSGLLGLVGIARRRQMA